MDKGEAREIVRRVLDEFRGLPHSKLTELIGEPQHREEVGGSGTTYQVEIEALWDSDRGGDIRVMAAIDDGGWRAFAPLTDSFIVSPDE
jgi:hypothetical protein